MEKLNVKLENCYGIKNLEYDFDFSDSNVYSIYAPNGTMKTSFLNTFKSLENNKEPVDEIYNKIEGTLKRITDYNISVDGDIIESSQIFTINSIDEKYQAKNLKDLLLNEELSIKLDHIFEKRSNFLNNLNNKSGKIGLDNIENILKNICGKTDSSFLEILEDINEKLDSYNDDYSNITYKDIYSLEDKIEKDDFQNNIDHFISKNEEIYASIGNKLLSKENNFGLFRLKNIQKNLKKDNFFFDENNGIIIKGVQLNKKILNDDIKNIDKLIKDSVELEEINKTLSTAGGNKLKELIEDTLIPIEELKNENRNEFYNKIVMSYIISEKDIFIDLLESFNEIKKEIKGVSESDEGTLWRKVIDEFNQRFHVPFKMKVSNVKSVILGESTEKIIFYFCDKLNKEEGHDDDWVAINSEENLKLVLSQGERRALYLLKILFEIENKIRLIDSGELGTQLLIIDDITDSFDYKNKYAIIQYLRDLSERKQKSGKKYFNLIILTHNFDFYRTVQSRLLITKNNDICLTKNLIAIKNNNGIVLDNGTGLLDSIVEMFNGCNSMEKLFALLPAVRNISEYTKNSPELGDNNSKNYNILTSIIHIKEDVYKLGDLITVYDDYVKINMEFNEEDNLDTIKIIKNLCDDIITKENINFESKVILSIGIRLESENFMMTKVGNMYFDGNQTWKLYKQCNNLLEVNEDNIMKEVFLMTPENIHLNSFMYEPILDMSDWHLKELYRKVKKLNEE